MSDPYIVVSYPLEASLFSTVDDNIEEYMRERGYKRWGSGGGFGMRDLEFNRIDSMRPDPLFAAQAQVELTNLTGLTVSVNLYG